MTLPRSLTLTSTLTLTLYRKVPIGLVSRRPGDGILPLREEQAGAGVEGVDDQESHGGGVRVQHTWIGQVNSPVNSPVDSPVGVLLTVVAVAVAPSRVICGSCPVMSLTWR